MLAAAAAGAGAARAAQRLGAVCASRLHQHANERAQSGSAPAWRRPTATPACVLRSGSSFCVCMCVCVALQMWSLCLLVFSPACAARHGGTETAAAAVVVQGNGSECKQKQGKQGVLLPDHRVVLCTVRALNCSGTTSRGGNGFSADRTHTKKQTRRQPGSTFYATVVLPASTAAVAVCVKTA